ncbi:MAG: hypothetical protein KBS95_04795 [Alistipes sp.]|nr:hypothetical protein [Candidatus Alistipes equi]
MAKKKFRISESDFLLANRKASREEEIALYGKQIIFRTIAQKSKKVYDRKRLKKADIYNNDSLSFLFRTKKTLNNMYTIFSCVYI